MDASNLQVSFIGGEIAPSFQGRADHPKYKSGLNKCFNSMPLETGAWQRRPGTRTAAITRAGLPGYVIDFDFSQNAPYTIELTDSHLRVFNNYFLLHTFDPQTVKSVSTANPAVVTFNANTYSNGDFVDFTLDNKLIPDQGSPLEGRQFLIGSSGGTTLALFDPVTGVGIDGSTLNFTAGTPCTCQRVFDLATPWNLGAIPDVRGVQALNGTVNTVVMLHSKVPAQALVSTNPPNPVFALSPASFIDGPYLDPVTDGTTITPSAVNGTVTLTASASKFAPTDVGRHIRLFSGPAAWAVGTAYAQGNLVSYEGANYVALQATTGNIPGTDAVNWGVAANASVWVWGIISVYTSPTVVNAILQVTSTAATQLPGVLMNTNAISVWRFGMFSYTTGFPATGTYHEGRLWLTGVLGNRVDGSVANEIFNFSPTAVDGTVADVNAIAYTFNAKDINSIFWMNPVQTGIVCGTQAGEWLIQSSNNSDPLTPTSIQAKRISTYGCANVEPVTAPFATLFVAKNRKRVFEYLADVFTGKYSGINVSLTGSHLTAPNVAQIKYQKELTPVAWTRMDDGSFAGMTYRRESPMLSEQPALAGWHSHALGNGRIVTSISVGPSVCGALDALTMVTYDNTDGLYRVELLTDMFPDNGTNLDAWHVDGGTTPPGSFLTANQLTLYGLSNYEGKQVSAYIAGVDAGDYLVTNGQAVIALPAAKGLLTSTTIAAASNLSNTSPSAMPVAYGTANFPANTQSLQSYIGPTVPVTGVSTDNVLVDAKNNRVFMFKEGSAATDGIRCFDITSGLQINQATHDQIFGVGSGRNIFAPFAQGYDGNIYMTAGASNSSRVYAINPDTLRITGFAGISSGSLTPSPTEIPFPSSIAPVRVAGANGVAGMTCGCSSPAGTNNGTAGGASFIVLPGLVVTNIAVAEMTNGRAQNAGHNFVLDEGRGYSCGTYDGSGVAYTIARTGGVVTVPLGLYKTVISPAASGYGLHNFPTVQNPGIVSVKLGTIAPAAIDAAWTHFSDSAGPAYDNSDGNLLLFVQTTDAVTNKTYLVKINAATAAVMWATAIPFYVSNALHNMSVSYIAYGHFAWLAAPNGTYYAVNTITGALTSTAINGMFVPNASVYNAALGSVFFNGDFAQTGGSPTLLNATPANFGSTWARLIVNADATPATGRQVYVVPACVGATFTSQGQRLRPLEPQETGARNGPALGKTRRNHRSAFLFLNTAGVKFGTTFANLKSALFKTKGGTAYLDNQLYSGIYSDTIEDDYSYDGMIAWQCTRPYPATVLSNQGFLDTQDR